MNTIKHILDWREREMMEAIINAYYSKDAKKLHKMVDKILIKLKFNVDNEDFYSLANEIFVDVIKRYDNSKSFDGCLYSCLMHKFKTEIEQGDKLIIIQYLLIHRLEMMKIVH